MTVVFFDVRKRYDTNHKHLMRVPGTNYDESLCADDTVCISTDARVTSIILAEI